MRQKSERRATPEQIVEDIRRGTRKHHSAEEKIRVVLEGLRGEEEPWAFTLAPDTNDDIGTKIGR